MDSTIKNITANIFNNGLKINSDGSFVSLINKNLVNLYGGDFCLYQGINGDTVLNSSSNQALEFKINNNEKMRIDSTGNIGINNISPQYPLDINGTVNCSNLIVGGITSDINLSPELLFGSSVVIPDNIKQNVLITLYNSTSASKIIDLPTNPKSGQIINFYNSNNASVGITTIRAQNTFGFFGYGMLGSASIVLNNQGSLSIQYSYFNNFQSNKWIVIAKY